MLAFERTLMQIKIIMTENEITGDSDQSALEKVSNHLLGFYALERLSKLIQHALGLGLQHLPTHGLGLQHLPTQGIDNLELCRGL